MIELAAAGGPPGGGNASAAAAALSHTRRGPAHLTGAGNYWLDVYDPSGRRIAARIWLLDSGDRGCASSRLGWCVAHAPP